MLGHFVWHNAEVAQNPNGGLWMMGSRSRWSAGGKGGEQYLEGDPIIHHHRPRVLPVVLSKQTLRLSETTFSQQVSAGPWPNAHPAIRVAAQRLAQYNLSELSGWKTSAPNLPIGRALAHPGSFAGRTPFSEIRWLLTEPFIRLKSSSDPFRSSSSLGPPEWPGPSSTSTHQQAAGGQRPR